MNDLTLTLLCATVLWIAAVGLVGLTAEILKP